MSAYLSICAIFKDEAPYLPEWIEFHRLVGVERFFLYDNGSGDAGDPYAVRHSSVKRVSVGRIRLHHYAVRSREEFEQKTARHGSSRMAPRYFAYYADLRIMRTFAL